LWQLFYNYFRYTDEQALERLDKLRYANGNQYFSKVSSIIKIIIHFEKIINE
jgi:hypothetical protein